jgi:hypothetical protein
MSAASATTIAATGGPMPVTTKEVTNYSVSVFSHAEPGQVSAAVMLFDQAGKAVAFLRFYPQGAAPAPNEYRRDVGCALVSYPQTSLAAVIDVLRNEKPLFFSWHDYLPERCFGAIGTSREPIGEGQEI